MTLAKEIALLLAVKLCLLYGLWWFFFSSPVDRAERTIVINQFYSEHPATITHPKG